MGEFEEIKQIYSNWIYGADLVEYVREIYPKSEVIQEVLDSGRIVHRAYSPFLQHNSKEQQLYMYNGQYFDFDSGNRGNIGNFIHHDFFSVYRNRSTGYISKKLGQDLNKILKNYSDKWMELVWESAEHNFVMDFEIEYFSKLGVNNVALSDGNWINSETGKWEEPKEYYLREFNNFSLELQNTILRFMPSVKKAIESAKLITPPSNNQLYK